MYNNPKKVFVHNHYNYDFISYRSNYKSGKIFEHHYFLEGIYIVKSIFHNHPKKNSIYS